MAKVSWVCDPSTTRCIPARDAYLPLQPYSPAAPGNAPGSRKAGSGAGDSSGPEGSTMPDRTTAGDGVSSGVATLTADGVGSARLAQPAVSTSPTRAKSRACPMAEASSTVVAVRCGLRDPLASYECPVRAKRS